MKLDAFAKSLLPNFSKDRVDEDIRITLDELKNSTIPAYKDAANYMRDWKFNNPIIINNIKVFNELVKKRKGNLVVCVYAALENAEANLKLVRDMIGRSYADDIVGTGLTYYKANLLQFTEVAHFVSRYARRYLNYLFVAETSMLPDQPTVEDTLAPADVDWIAVNFANFCLAINVVNREARAMSLSTNIVPDIVITDENATTVEQTMGSDKVDPLQMGFIPVVLNPCYHIGMALAEWQTNRYHAAKQEVKVLQLRRMNLENLVAGKPNPQVQKQIEYAESRIQGYLREIDKLEKKNGR